MAGLTVHWRAAAPGVRAVLHRLTPVLGRDRWYLAGGTAIALLECHRVSRDLDLFCSTMDDPEAMLRTLEEADTGVESSAVGAGAIDAVIDGVRVSLLRYRYPLLEPPVTVASDVLDIAHRDDIAAMKLAAVTGRGSRKDFIDLWTLITRHHPLEHYLGCFQRKFATRDVGHVLRSLVYFEDAELEPPLRMLTEVDWTTVKTDFRRWVTDLLPPSAPSSFP